MKCVEVWGAWAGPQAAFESLHLPSSSVSDFQGAARGSHRGRSSTHPLPNAVWPSQWNNVLINPPAMFLKSAGQWPLLRAVSLADRPFTEDC